MNKAVIFDLDGTLINTIDTIARLLNQVLNQFQLPTISVDQCKGFVGDGASVLVERALLSIGYKEKTAELGRLKNLVLSTYEPLLAKEGAGQVHMYDEIPFVLDQLSLLSIPMSILSNKPQRALDTVVKEVLSPWTFQGVIGESCRFKRKPHPEGALYLAKILQESPEHIVFVGDSPVDVLTAQQTNMVSVGVTWGFNSKSSLVNQNPKYIIDKPTELLELFKLG